MNQKQTWAEKWSTQSDASRIANSLAFALAAAGLAYGFLKGLVPLFLWVHSLFGTKGNTFTVTSRLALIVLMAAQVGIATQCSAARKKMEQMVYAGDNDDAGFYICSAALVVLYCLGLACSFMLMDVPAKPEAVDSVSVMGLILLNSIVFFVAIAIPAALLSESTNVPEDPLAIFGYFTVGLGIAFLLPGFGSITFALWVANVVLTFMLRPVSIAYEVLNDGRRGESAKLVVDEGPFLGV